MIIYILYEGKSERPDPRISEPKPILPKMQPGEFINGWRWPKYRLVPENERDRAQLIRDRQDKF